MIGRTESSGSHDDTLVILRTMAIPAGLGLEVFTLVSVAFDLLSLDACVPRSGSGVGLTTGYCFGR